MIAFVAALIGLTAGLNIEAGAKPKSGKDDDHSLLWVISGKGLAKPSYLFGTIHIICLEDYVWTKSMKESLHSSDKVCFEMDLDDPSVMMQVAAGMMDKSGHKLRDYFTPDQYKQVKQYVADSIGMDIAMFDQMKPIFLQTLMETKKSMGCPNPMSYEDSIGKTAASENKEVLGLESPDEQLKALATLSVDSVIKDILQQVQGKGDDRSEYAQLLAAYRKQDLPALYNLITQSPDAGEDIGPLLDERNKKWISRIAEKAKVSSVFFAVGAGHLYGSNGVINLLRKEGYTVEPVK